MTWRIRVFAASFVLAFAILFGRLFYWQVVKGQALASKARLQFQDRSIISASRGDILSSDGSWLAASAEGYLLYASLPDIKDDNKRIAELLAPLFVEQESERHELLEEIDRIELLLERNGVVWVPIKRKLTRGVKEKIESFEIEGIGFESGELRIYPESSSAAHLLGFVGKNQEGEDEGYFGLEGYYDLSLTGKTGYVSREADAMGVPILFGDLHEVSAIGGVNLITSIEKPIQLLLEEKLKNSMDIYGAKAATAIVMRPSDGAILAMSSYPSFDPAEYYKYSDKEYKNPSISSSYEPGSIFKVLIMAAALDAEVIEPDTKCDICAGPLRVDKYWIETWNQEYNADSTMVDVIVHSDNVGMVFVGNKLGANRLYEYLSKFGIGELTGVDLQGEATPKLRYKESWSVVDVATASFGQGVAVTPMQMIRAVSSLANGGVITSPYVVKKVGGDGWEEKVNKQLSKRVISKKSASEITAMMVEAAKNGEAKWTHARGFKVAGKTGTAQIPIAGHYDKEKTIASFVGFAPYDDPEFVMLVTLREPETSPWASETAAPLWYEIAKDLFIYFGIQPEN